MILSVLANLHRRLAAVCCILTLFYFAYLSVAQATTYPLTVKDLAQQTVVINKEPKRIILQDGRDILALALLDRENPFKRLVAWNNLIKRSDASTWKVLSEHWPEALAIPDMGFSDQGEVNNEEVIAKQPDLLIAQLRAKPALEQTGVLKRFKMLNIPVLFIDYNRQPIQNTAASLTLLGNVLNQQQRAHDYTQFYQQHLQHIQQLVSQQKKKPLVFIEPIAGNSDNCCFTHAGNGWGGLIEAAGGVNLGTTLLTGATGFINPEQIIAMQPNWYLMTGSGRNTSSSPLIPFGYHADPKQIKQHFERLLQRPAVAQIPAVVQGHVAGLYHHFYNHPWNIIGVEILAKLFYPKALGQLNPIQDYHTIVTQFTQIPDAPVTLSYQPKTP